MWSQRNPLPNTLVPLALIMNSASSRPGRVLHVVEGQRQWNLMDSVISLHTIMYTCLHIYFMHIFCSFVVIEKWWGVYMTSQPCLSSYVEGSWPLCHHMLRGHDLSSSVEGSWPVIICCGVTTSVQYMFRCLKGRII